MSYSGRFYSFYNFPLSYSMFTFQYSRVLPLYSFCAFHTMPLNLRLLFPFVLLPPPAIRFSYLRSLISLCRRVLSHFKQPQRFPDIHCFIAFAWNLVHHRFLFLTKWLLSHCLQFLYLPSWFKRLKRMFGSHSLELF